MTYTSRLIELIKRGREGDNQGLSLGMPKLEHIIDGLTQETYYLIAAGTGNGKTSFVLHSFIYKALLDSDSDKDVQFIIFSLEMSAEQLLAKLLSLHIYETYGKQISFKAFLIDVIYLNSIVFRVFYNNFYCPNNFASCPIA